MLTIAILDTPHWDTVYTLLSHSTISHNSGEPRPSEISTLPRTSAELLRLCAQSKATGLSTSPQKTAKVT